MAYAEDRTVGLIDNDLSVGYILPSAVLGFLILLTWRWMRKPKIPTINSYFGDITLRKAHSEFMSNARGLVKEGVAKFNGPFRIITTLGSRVILPASYTEWLKGCLDLDHQALVHDEYFAAYPGMEGQSVVTDPGKILINVTKTKLNHNDTQCGLFHEHITNALGEIWKDGDDWHTVDWAKDGIRFVGRMSASIFVGPDLAQNPKWQELILTSTMNTFMGVRSLRAWPAFLRPVVHWFLPELRTCREQLRLARLMLQPIFDRRGSDKTEKSTNTIQWLEEVAAGRPYDAAAAQIAFAISAMHTTSELLKQALLDICVDPELVSAIRDEINKAVEESGWSAAGVFKMQLLDSAVKETLRLKPGSLVNLERKALRDVVLPNGMTISRGTNIAVDSSMMWDPAVYTNPSSLSFFYPEHIAFGLGKPVCPGRFFASNEVKIALAKILLTYDVRIPEGFTPKMVELGFEMICDPTAKVEIRKRPAL
ncbi:Cytochrome P450 [Penicillium expansum]|nr:Cytochrome P450 [Penicillium expansum]